MQEQHERDAEGGDEQEVGRHRDVEQVGGGGEQLVPDRQDEQRHRDEHPEQRVALHQPAPPDQLEHHADQQGGDHHRRDPDAAVELRGGERQPRDGGAHRAFGSPPAPETVGARRKRPALGLIGAVVDGDRPPAKQAHEQRQQHLGHVVGAARVVDRAAAEAAGVHPHRHLVDPQPVRVQHQDRLDLGVVVRVVAREQLDPAPVRHPEAGGRIADPLAADRGQDDREDQVADPAAERHLVAGIAAVAAAADHVRLVARGLELGQQIAQVGGLVLAVSVDLGGDVVGVPERVLEAGLHRAADPGVEGMAQDDRAAVLGLGRGLVGRAVVDHHDVEVGGVAADLAHHAAHHPLLVVGGDDR